MPRDVEPTTRAVMAVIELQGYRVGIGEPCRHLDRYRQEG